MEGTASAVPGDALLAGDGGFARRDGEHDAEPKGDEGADGEPDPAHVREDASLPSASTAPTTR